MNSIILHPAVVRYPEIVSRFFVSELQQRHENDSAGVGASFGCPTFCDMMDVLPDEVILKVAQCLDDAKDLISLAKSCYAMYTLLLHNEEVWKSLCVHVWMVDERASPPSWRLLYKFNHDLRSQLRNGSDWTETQIHMTTPSLRRSTCPCGIRNSGQL